MADQTSVRDHNGKPEAPARAIGRNVSEFAHDFTALADLQLKLLSVDMKQAMRRLRLPTILAIVAGALALGTIPVILLGIGYLFIEYAELSVAWSFLLTALLSLIVVAILLGVAYARIRGSMSILNRSRDEFIRNVNWIKMVLQHPRSAPTETVRTP